MVVSCYIYDHGIARLGGFPQNRPFGLGSLSKLFQVLQDPKSCKHRLSPGPEREAMLDDLLKALQEQTGDVAVMIKELRELMVGRDLTQLINSVAVRP